VDASPAKITASEAHPPASQLASTLGAITASSTVWVVGASKMKGEPGSAERVRAHQEAHPTE